MAAGRRDGLVVSVWMAFVVLVAVFGVVLNVPLVWGSGTIYIRADGSIDPPTANITSVNNVTYTFTDNINDSIVVERDNIVVDGAGYTVQAGGDRGIDIHVYEVGGGRSNITVKNMGIKARIGIYTHGTSRSTLSDNDITGNVVGIDIDYYSSWNIIARNNISNNDCGISLIDHSSYNIITGNNITENTYYGIQLYSTAPYNTITRNNLANNEYGIYLLKSSNHVIYHNNFLNNTRQVYDRSWDLGLDPSINTWDNGYPSGGNYWSDYNGVDEKSGPNQDQPGSDGIGDTPYVIDENNQDRYPLMGPIGFFNAGTWDETTYYIHTVSNSTVSDFYFSRDDKLVSFDVNGTDDTVGFCGVTIQRDLMWCDALEEWNVTVDGNTPTYLKVMEDADYTYLYFTYSHTIRNVKIASTYVIEEVPPPVEEEVPFWMQWWLWAIVAVVIVALAGIVYFLKKRKPPTPTAPTPPPEGT